MQVDLNIPINIFEFQNDFQEKIQQLEKLTKNVKSNSKQFDVSDLQELLAEEKLELLVQSFENKNKQLLVDVKEMTYAEKKYLLINSQNDSNLYLMNAQKLILQDQILRKEVLDVCCVLDKIQIPKIDQQKQILHVIQPLKSIQIRNQNNHIPKIEKNYLKIPILNEANQSLCSKNLIFQRGKDILIHISIYNSSSGQKASEFLFDSQNTILDVMQNIHCNLKHEENQFQQGEFLFIENDFYIHNDDITTFICENQKLAISQLEYHKQNRQKLNSYNVKNAADHKLEQLTLRIGKIYIYRHLNCCDHMVVFNNLRMINQKDNLMAINYPIQIFQNKIKRRKCYACQTYFAIVICCNDRVSLNEKIFLCDFCYKNTHNDSNNQLKYNDFQVYKYYHE